MSIAGPCFGLPALSSPVPSSFTAVTSHLSTAGRYKDRASSLTPRTLSPTLTQSKQSEPGAPTSLTEMHQTGVQAETALPAAGPSLYSGGQTSSRDTGVQRSGISRSDLLPRVKLEIPGGNGGSLTMSQSQVGAGHHEDMNSSQMLLDDAKDEHDKESSLSPSDEKDETMGEDENQRSPILDKKKMKRFRLTHNQTRYLMSEFTRQAHPDAAHRERLSREIPGLTPRQVQVWFQNRRAKLKRLTSNDRERVLKSRALPDDFDTTKVLRTPFEGNSAGQTPNASPQTYGPPNPDFAALRALRTDIYHRPHDDDYLVSPFSSVSAAGTYMSQGRDGLPQSNLMFGRPAASASLGDLHRTIRNDYSVTRSSSLSESSSQTPTYHAGMHMYHRYGNHTNQPGISMRQPNECGVPRPNGLVSGYEQHQPFEGSVSPTDSQGGQVPYEVNGSQSQGYPPHLAMHSQIQAQGRPMSNIQEYRPYSYSSSSGSMASMPYTQTNASSMSLPSFASSEPSSATTDQMHQSPQTIESMRSKMHIPSYNYPNYIQQ